MRKHFNQKIKKKKHYSERKSAARRQEHYKIIDRRQTNRRKTKIEEARRMLTRPGRLERIDVPTAWSRSGPVRRRGARKVEFPRQGYPRLPAGALQTQVPKGRMLMNKSQNETAKMRKAPKIESKGCLKRPPLIQKGTKKRLLQNQALERSTF